MLADSVQRKMAEDEMPRTAVLTMLTPIQITEAMLAGMDFIVESNTPMLARGYCACNLNQLFAR